MIHDGIEYADMQLIPEAYHVLRSGSCLRMVGWVQSVIMLLIWHDPIATR
jgi:6-phosphogluconate dehydrogenase